jgi:hypothetical protein
MAAKRILWALCITAALALCGAGASGATYYVATGGGDSNPGTAGQPWLTLDKAVNSVQPGDTIIVGPGTYAGCTITVSGEEGKPKTLKAEVPGSVVLNSIGPRNRQGSVLEVYKSVEDTVGYWVIDGINIDAGKDKGAFDLRHTTHCTVRNCESIDGKTWGFYASYAESFILEKNISHGAVKEHGVYIANGSDNGIVRGNTVYNTNVNGIQINADVTMPASDGISSNFVIERNVIHDVGESGFNMDGVEKSVFRNNLVYSYRDKGMAFFAIDAAIASRNNRILNNTIISRPGGDSYFCISIRHTNDPSKPAPVGNKLFNNILYHYSTAGGVGSLNVDKTGFVDFESDYNVVMDYFGIDDNESHETLAQWRERGCDKHSVQAKAAELFVAPETFDFHLKEGSPAIDKGTALPDVTEDLEGNARPRGAGYDIGCYERQ